MKKAAIDRHRIKQVIYPTLGQPAIVRHGERLTLEFDPRRRDWSRALPQLTGFHVSATTTNSADPATSELPLQDYTIGFSARWPEYSSELEPRALVYLVTVEVPGTVPAHLHDLTVTATLRDGSTITDSQPHALQVVNEYKKDYSFAHMTDIHVSGQEAAYIGSNTHQRGWRHKEYSEDDGYGAVYYHKSVQQMNKARPDFLIYTGDYDFGLTWLYEKDYADFEAYRNSPWAEKLYETWFELDWFYTETLKLDVPVFMVPGNHDGWARFDELNEVLEEDYMASWKELFGPRYFSFDYGPDSHFVGINSMDWTPSERALHWALPMELLGPHKWQGQVTGGGDEFETGWSKEREGAVREDEFEGQLRWVKEDLEAHASAKMKAMLLHHCPWKTDGSGSMFEHMPVIPGLEPWGGRGTGRLALIRLAREYNVGVVLSGHDHSDAYGTVEWTAGGGEVKFANTTSTQFQDGDRQGRWEYPGYRLVRVRDGKVENCYYQAAGDEDGNSMHYSWPFYAGTTVGGPNDLDALEDPAIDAEWDPRPGRARRVECTITNRLTGSEISAGGGWSGDLDSAYVEFPMPYLSGGHYYTVTNGTIVDVFDDKSGKHRTYGVTTRVSHAKRESEPSRKTVTISKSAKPDTKAPTCAAFLIKGGAPTTSEARVKLTNDAVDTGGSGLQDMKIWNDGEDEAAAPWCRYQASTEWELRREPGARAVYVRFRDGAMPGNVSEVYSATIELTGTAPAISGVAPGPACVGESVAIEGSGFGGRRTAAGIVRFDEIAADVKSWGDERIVCVVPQGACTGEVTVSTDTGDAGNEFHVMPLVQRIVPDFCYTGLTHIDNLEGTGFLIGGKPPQVTLSLGTIELTAKNVEVVSPQSITCDFDLSGVISGYYSVKVEQEDGFSDMLAGCLVVDFPPPAITGLTTDSGANTGPVDITNLAGEGFIDGMRAWLIKGRTRIEATNVVVTSPGKATCTFDITGAGAGKWRVRVENKDGKAGTLSRGFTVK